METRYSQEFQEYLQDSTQFADQSWGNESYDQGPPAHEYLMEAVALAMKDKDQTIAMLQRDRHRLQAMIGLLARALMGPTVGAYEQGGLVVIGDRQMDQAHQSQRVYFEHRASSRAFDIVVTGPNVLGDDGLLVTKVAALQSGEDIDRPPAVRKRAASASERDGWVGLAVAPNEEGWTTVDSGNTEK